MIAHALELGNVAAKAPGHFFPRGREVSIVECQGAIPVIRAKIGQQECLYPALQVADPVVGGVFDPPLLAAGLQTVLLPDCHVGIERLLDQWPSDDSF